MNAAASAGALVETIVAAATAPGQGRRALIRLSGPLSWAISVRLLSLERTPRPGRVGRGWFELAADTTLVTAVGEPLPVPHAAPPTASGSVPASPSASDPAASSPSPSGTPPGPAPVPVELLVFRAPRSLTGEDVVEWQLPGWPALVVEALRRCVAAGARPAARGEFLRRAVANGRLDLSRALAVGQLAASRAVEEAARAAACLSGGTARRGAALREELLATLALLEAHVDFEESDTEAIDSATVLSGVERAAVLARELSCAGERRASCDGETDVVLLGPPNAGKSSLLLALCPGAETTVSPQPGTTRDALVAVVDHGGRRWRLIDGPGVGAAADALEALAAERFLEGLPPAAVVLLLEPVPQGPGDEAARQRRLAAVGQRVSIPVVSRCDLLPAGAPRPSGLATSAVTGEGLPGLWQALHRAAPAPGAPDLLERAESEAAAEILPLLEAALAEDPAGALPILSLHLRQAIERLEQESESPLDVTAEVLERIFSSFCIGK